MKEYGIPKKNVYNYETFDRIADNPDIDIIYIVLPNFMHAEYTIRAAQTGKHVICEKPMAMNVPEAKQMIEACQKNKVQLSVGYRLYFQASPSGDAKAGPRTSLRSTESGGVWVGLHPSRPGFLAAG